MEAALSKAPGVKGFTLAASTFRSGESLMPEGCSSPSLVKRSRGLAWIRGGPPTEQAELGEVGEVGEFGEFKMLSEPMQGSL